MHDKKNIIYVGAKPDLDNNHAGGQSTASIGLIEYADLHEINLQIIDSAQESFPIPSFIQRVSKAKSRVLQLVNLLRKDSIHGVIIFSSAGFSFYEKSFLALICRFFCVKCLLFVRSGHFITECNKSSFKRSISKLLLKIPTQVGAQGSQWKEFYNLLGVPNQKISIIRNWLPSNRSISDSIKTYQESSELELTFVFVGWVVKNKGIFELIEAIKQSAALKKCKFLIAGGGEGLEQIRNDVIGYKLDRVELLGWQSPSQIDDLLNKSHVFVLPTYAEGFPNALLEAISQGLPAVISPVGSVADSAIQGENAEWVIPQDITSLRLALEKFYEKPELVEKYSINSIRIAKIQHSRKDNCRKLFEHF